jgi:hypothetical protein
MIFTGSARFLPALQFCLQFDANLGEKLNLQLFSVRCYDAGMKKYFLFAIILLTGCGMGSGNKTYYNPQKPDNFLLLRSDKTCLISSDRFITQKNYSCTYRVDKDIIEIKYEDKSVEAGKIENGAITLKGETFKDSPPPKAKEPTANKN